MQRLCHFETTDAILKKYSPNGELGRVEDLCDREALVECFVHVVER